MKRATGAQVVALGGDAVALESGQDNSALGAAGWEPVEVDRVVEDGDTLTLGGTMLRAVWTGGHTQGATMWMTTVQEGGQTFDVAFRGGEIPNAGAPLVDNPRHPTVVEDTQRTLRLLKELEPPDLFLHNHPRDTYPELNPDLPVNPICASCLDAEGWTEMVERLEASFQLRLTEPLGFPLSSTGTKSCLSECPSPEREQTTTHVRAMRSETQLAKFSGKTLPRVADWCRPGAARSTNHWGYRDRSTG